MKIYNLEWKSADVKFVEALLLATGGEGGAPLQEVLLMGDALDGTIFSLPDVEQALLKLTAAECLNIQNNKLSLSSEFLTDYEAAVEAIPDISDAERIQELLGCHTLSDSKVAEAGELLKKYKLKNYYQQYQEQFG